MLIGFLPVLSFLLILLLGAFKWARFRRVITDVLEKPSQKLILTFHHPMFA